MNAALELLTPALERGLGDQIALLGSGGALTYRELQTLAWRNANALATAGVRPGERVLLLLRDTPALAGAYLGILAAGAVAVTVNLRSTPAEIAHVLRDSGCALALLDSAALPLWREATGESAPCAAFTVGAPAAGLPPWEPALAAASPRFDPVPLAGDAMAFWIYTSGTTGEIKACVHRQRDVVLGDAYLRDVLGVRPGMRLFATSKLFFAYALGTCLFGSLRLGATTILLDEWPTPENVLALLERHQPHVVFSVPAFYRALLAAGAGRQGAGRRSAVRAVGTWVSAGERLGAELYRRWLSEVGTPIVEGLGTSETLHFILSHRPGTAAPGTVGRPAPGVEARRMDEAGREVTAPGLPGMLWTRMGSTCAGYWNQPEATAAAFRDGWFVTGDRFTVDGQGHWRHEGRQEELMAGPGGALNPADVEERLQEIPGILDACLMTPGGAGAGGAVVHAVPAPGADRASLAGAIAAEVARWLPPPARPVRVAWRAALPRTASGKVQRYRLREETEAP